MLCTLSTIPQVGFITALLRVVTGWKVNKVTLLFETQTLTFYLHVKDEFNPYNDAVPFNDNV
jgi:hypothetical protein